MITDERKKEIDMMFEKYVGPLLNSTKFVEDLAYLWVRWQDEGKYEGWAGYEEVLKRHVPKDCTFVRSTKRPMGLVYRVPKISRPIHIFGKARGNDLQLIVKVLNA